MGKEFKLIEEDTKTIFIGREPDAEDLLQKIKGQGYTKSTMRKIGQYCVQLYENEFEKMRGAGMVSPVSGDIEDFYELVEKDQYSDEMGLKMDVESGMAVIM